MACAEAIGIAAIAAVEAVITGTAVEGVVAVAAIQGVIAGTAVEGIITAIAVQGVITVIPEEGVSVVPAAEAVILGGAVDGNAHGGDVLGGEGLIVEDNAEGAGISVTEIVRNGDGVIGTVGVDEQVIAHFFYRQVVSGGAFEDEGISLAVLIVIDSILAMAGPEAIGVAAFAAVEAVIAGTAVEGVVAVAAIQGVIAGTAVEGIITAIAVQGVITVIPEEGVSVVPAAEAVILGGAVDGNAHGGDVLGGEGLIVEDNAEGAGISVTEIVRNGDGVIGTVGVDEQVIAHFFYRQVVSGGAFEDEGISLAVLIVIDSILAMAGPEAIGVAAFAAVEAVIAGTAVEGVVAALTIERVITVITLENIVGTPAGKAVIFVRAINREAHGEDVLSGEGLIVEDNAEGAGISVTEIVRNGDGVIGTVGVDEQVIPHFFYRQVVGGSAFENEDVISVINIICYNIIAMPVFKKIRINTACADESIITL